jgi:hypothetical protein
MSKLSVIWHNTIVTMAICKFQLEIVLHLQFVGPMVMLLRAFLTLSYNHWPLSTKITDNMFISCFHIEKVKPQLLVYFLLDKNVFLSLTLLLSFQSLRKTVITMRNSLLNSYLQALGWHGVKLMIVKVEHHHNRKTKHANNTFWF